MSEDYGWVIEAGWSNAPDIKYWSGCNITGGGGIQHTWRTDNSQAIRFAREQDAKKAAKALIDGEAYRVVEHAWASSIPNGARETPQGER